MNYRLQLRLPIFLSLLAACSPPNTVPTISSIADQEVLQNTLPDNSFRGEVAFNIADVEDDVSLLIVSASTDSPMISTPNETTPSCTALGECTLVFLVSRAAAASATITVSVRDSAGGKANTSFEVVVAPKPLGLSGSNDEQALRDSLEQAQEGEVIGFDLSGKALPYTITLTSELEIHSRVSLQGPGNADLILDAASQTRHFRVFPAAVFGLHGLQLNNGQAQDDGSTVYDEPIGGSIFNEGSLEVTDSLFTRNAAINGGGIYNFGAAAHTVIRKALFGGDTAAANTAGRSGAAVFNDGGLLEIFGSSLSFNKAVERGAAAYNLGQNALLIIDSSTIKNNVAKDGGGIKNELGKVRLQNGTVLENNIATIVEGGGLFNTRGTIEIIDSSLLGNKALEGTGGALYSFGPEATILLDHSTVSGNSAVTAGGLAHEVGSQTLLIRNSSVISHNQARGSAGGIYNGGTLIISADSQVTGNQADADQDGTGVGGGILNLGDISGVAEGTVSGNTPDDIAP
jgi:hypothetical protein